MPVNVPGKLMDIISSIRDSPLLGIIHAVNSTILLVLANYAAQVALLSSHALSELEVLWIRNIGKAVMLVPLLLLSRSQVLFGSDRWLLQFLISVSGYLCGVAINYSLKLIPFSIALSISATCPIFASLFSACILNEKCICLDMVCGVVGFIGVLLIARPIAIFGKYGVKETVFYGGVSQTKYESIYISGCGIALLLGMSRAMYLVLARKWSRIPSKDKPNQMLTVFYPSVFGCICTPMLMVVSGKVLVIPKPLYGTCLLFTAGIIAVLGLISLTNALKTQNATVVGFIRNLECLWSFLLQYAAMGIVPSPWSVCGACVIVVTTIIATCRQHILEKISSCRREETSLESILSKSTSDEE